MEGTPNYSPAIKLYEQAQKQANIWKWQSYVNANKTKLNLLRKRWFGKEYTKEELFRLFSGIDDPLGTRANYLAQVKSFKGRADMYKKQGKKKKAESVMQSIKVLKTQRGKTFQQLNDEIDQMNKKEAGAETFTKLFGFRLPSPNEVPPGSKW